MGRPDAGEDRLGILPVRRFSRMEADKRAACPLAAVVDRAGKRLSAAARLAFDENRQGGAGGSFGQPSRPLPFRMRDKAGRILSKGPDVVCEKPGKGHEAAEDGRIVRAMLGQKGKPVLNGEAFGGSSADGTGLIQRVRRPICVQNHSRTHFPAGSSP